MTTVKGKFILEKSFRIKSFLQYSFSRTQFQPSSLIGSLHKALSYLIEILCYDLANYCSPRATKGNQEQPRATKTKNVVLQVQAHFLLLAFL